MRLYESTTPEGQRKLIVWLDERKFVTKDDPRIESDGLTAGSPDPDWCFEQVWPAYDPATAPETGSETEWTPPEDDPEAQPPMRKLTQAEVEAQQEAETVALAREELARRQAEDTGADEDDPFADGGVAV